MIKTSVSNLRVHNNSRSFRTVSYKKIYVLMWESVFAQFESFMLKAYPLCSELTLYARVWISLCSKFVILCLVFQGKCSRLPPIAQSISFMFRIIIKCSESDIPMLKIEEIKRCFYKSMLYVNSLSSIQIH